MDYKAIYELIELINKSDLAFLEVKAEDIYIKMDKSYNRNIVNETISHENINIDKKEILQNTLEVADKVDKIEQEAIKDNEGIITSPMVGTFYLYPAPDKEPFVKKGEVIKKGDILCIIEAMKLMNEIESDVDGEIVDILVENETMVEYGQPLFKIRK